ncbi:peptidoglycan-binding domain-containing protein [Actibacterium lipolyticum]|uniref:Putative peptidoglycan binding domain protein n=1 Tax=Actibacterium lipolyticum TaxID=1524263 RepID=A0A238KTR3_9RHOB|nr:peptidoglycan-binding domain-containing protein [Actibacterium lipolyticum]SMX46189.1 Putative peptidoglycan binding domain protein [Actibacterium lipolyticum]
MRRILMTTTAAILLSSPLFAADLAYIVGNEDYDNFSDVRGGEDAADAVDAFAKLPFDTVVRADATATDIAASLAEFVERAGDAQRVVVVLSGLFVHSDRDAWLLPVDSETPNLATLPQTALPISTVLTVLSQHQGQAILLLGADDDDDAQGPYLREGIGNMDVPHGVTVYQGGPRAVARFAEDRLAVPGTALTSSAFNAGLVGSGYIPQDRVFIAKDIAEPAPVATDDTAEMAYWDATVAQDSEDGYAAYLKRYPDGEHAALAQAKIEEIRAEPNRAARLAEEALNLNRDQRREIQRDLSILDYNPRGIDGIFGPGSRGAITKWQQENAFDATSYLTRDQLTRLDAQAEKRAAELEAEAEARRVEQERQDRAYWAETGAAGDEAGLRVYLKRYPDGVFAEVAQERLAVIDEGKRAEAAAQDRAAWDVAVQANTEAAYRDYLTAMPSGAFAEDAKARIAEMTQADQNADEIARAERIEQNLRLNSGTRRLIEERLQALGLKPGAVDGVFDDKTRRAIRRYQTARQITVTGYLNQETVVRLMADSIFK